MLRAVEALNLETLYYLYSLAIDKKNNRYPKQNSNLKSYIWVDLILSHNQIGTCIPKPLNWPFCFAEACLTQEGGSED